MVGYVKHRLPRLVRCSLMRGTCNAGRDFGVHELTLVGVYPVVEGYAQLDMKLMAKLKGNTKYNPLYITPGDAFKSC